MSWAGETTNKRGDTLHAGSPEGILVGYSGFQNRINGVAMPNTKIFLNLSIFSTYPKLRKNSGITAA